MRTVALRVCVLVLLAAPSLWAQEDDTNSKLPAGSGRDAVIANCTACHSAAIILQNRMSRSEWDALITWMQEEQGLWELEPAVRKSILDYLAKHRGPDAPTGQGDAALHPNPMYQYHYPPNPL